MTAAFSVRDWRLKLSRMLDIMAVLDFYPYYASCPFQDFF
jgi:hypothetical protein